MNYKKEMLESKVFNFSKQLLNNALLAVCVALFTALLVVHFSNCAISVVLSDSMSPSIESGDYLLVQEKLNYKIGDIIQFEDSVTGLNITHRIVAIKNDGNKNYFICCGDVENLTNGEDVNQKISTNNWQNNAQYVENLSLEQVKIQLSDVVQIVEQNSVKGKIVEKLAITTWLVDFVKRNWLFLLVVLLLIETNFKNLSFLDKNRTLR